MRVVVVGADGYLGSRICETLISEGVTVLRVGRRAHDTDSLLVDLTIAQDVARLTGEVRDQVVVYCANVGGRAQAQKDPKAAAEVNGRIPGLLASAARRLIYFSTDYVFSGSGAPASVGSAPNPDTTYGCTKLAGERSVLSAQSNATVIRTSGLYDVRGTRNGSFKDWDAIEVPDNSLSTPTAVADVVDCCLRLLKGGPPIIHCVGPQALTAYEFYVLAALRWGFKVIPTLTDAPRTRVLERTTAHTRSASESLLRPSPVERHEGRGCVVFDTVGVVLAARRWKHSEEQFWLDQEALVDRGSDSLTDSEVTLTEQAYTFNPALPALWTRFSSASCRVLANNGPLATFERWVDRFDFASVFELTVNSERDGVAKPAPAFFDFVASGSGIRGGGLLLDDRLDVVAGARRVGWTAHLTRKDGAPLVDRFDIDPPDTLECEPCR